MTGSRTGATYRRASPAAHSTVHSTVRSTVFSVAPSTAVILACALTMAMSGLAVLSPGLGSAVHASTAPNSSDSPTFPAPAQRSIVHFDTPSQRTPEPATASAGAAGGDTGNGTDTSDATEITVANLTDPATGLGPVASGRIPEGAAQVLVASGADDNATHTELALWEKSDDEWRRTATMTGRNGGSGWKEDRHEGDRSTPAGVFSLSDAGGFLADPGTLLPYYRDEGLRSGAEAVYGDAYSSVFDYVIAIDYNRKTGVAPTENTRPMGWDAGGKIWLHVEHGNPTRGCIALPEADMEALLTTLDPSKLPHIAMGSQESLAQ